jgi:hypothetical protein
LVFSGLAGVPVLVEELWAGCLFVTVWPAFGAPVVGSQDARGRVDGSTFGKVRASGHLPGPSRGAPMAGAASARLGAVSKAPKGAIGG